MLLEWCCLTCSGRPAVDIRLEEEQHSLATWARYCKRKGKVDKVVDHNLIRQISPACLKVFVGIAGRCLDTHPHENWVAKVSDFGLSRRKGVNGVPTIVRANWGFLDSDYIQDDRLTEKSYIFSFGLLLFEVLCATKESTRWLDEDQVSLAQWIKTGIRNNLSGYIDPYLAGKIAPECFSMFIGTAAKCLLDKGTERPSMSDIVGSLEDALKLQEAADSAEDV